jgi:DNA-binding response OmpR family regulator
LRLRILRLPNRSIEGFNLGGYKPGLIYDVGLPLSAILLSEGWAEPIPPGVVLVIDDDADIRLAFTLFLQLHGYTVVMAAHGREGLIRMAECRPDAIVLDLNMPIMNGWEFRAEQKGLADKGLASIPVLLVSAETDAQGQAAALNTKFIEKPIDIDRLLVEVNTMVHRTVA